ncbi:hypothetical protein DEU56DRAFT_173519 [Suillus clintonianus]|uniref:uncharacterized protein n=1 Tax=Suillus clintonianus TaxID=1904413 RepID=UPI001B87DB9A|nr:uncharacterized protein DEU56DRAFT_173519 [Suillus clintonianus]KAG2116169.1 hypothetical protein DEU56DRAFT_173519 [Suillus clintonianus]
MVPSPIFMEDLWVRQIFSAVGHTLLVYDYFLTLKDETRYIWNSPWTVVKALFLINRYGNLLGQTVIRLEEAGLFTNSSQTFCNHFAFFTSCFTILSTESIHILVLIRARAIWGTQKCLTNILIWSYVSYVLVLIGTGTYGVLANHGLPPHCFSFSCTKNDCALAVQFLYIDVTHVCVKEITSSAVNWQPYIYI